MKTTNDTTCLTDHFLIAMPSLSEGIFADSITYICEHNAKGTMGIIINQPLDLSLNEIFTQLNIAESEHSYPEPILAGGPVQMDRGFVLHDNTHQHWESSLTVSEQIALTTSQDILAAIARGQGPKQSLVALGYAGWGPGQLEQEIADNAWLTIPADSEIIFNTPLEQRATVAAAKLGIDLALISPHAGHA